MLNFPSNRKIHAQCLFNYLMINVLFRKERQYISISVFQNVYCIFNNKMEIFYTLFFHIQVILVVKKNLPANVERNYRFPRLGRSPGGEHSNSLQCSCLESYKDRGARWGIVHRVTKGQIRLKLLIKHVHFIFKSMSCL